MALELVSIDTITIDENYRSVFSTVEFPQSPRGELWISEQEQCLNLRYRSSSAGYESDWHVAGDPTLIVISSGCLEVELRDGSRKQFSAGSKFIARDFLPPHLDFDSSLHGHRARVIGEEELTAIHIKLANI